MPPPLAPAKRAAILADIREGGTCRGIATKHKVSVSTVSKIASDEGETFERSQTEKATRARVADLAAMRAQLAADLMADTQRLRERAWSEYQVVQNTREGPEVVRLDRPPLRDVQAAYTSIAIAADKSAMLIRQDSDGGAEKAKGIVGALVEGLRAAADALPPETPS